MKIQSTLMASLFALLLNAGADDWPMWRHDPGRTAATPGSVPEKLHLQWTLELPPLKPAYRDHRLQFDLAYQPIVTRGRLIIGSARSGSVTAYDAVTGKEGWRFHTGGPVRFAPASENDRVFVGSDDGFLYCLALDSGKLLWKFRAAPARRKVLGNGHMISLWPVRGGPVTRDGKVWFAAGVWPMEGVFIHCLDARTGRSLWINDACGFRYGQQPHNAQAHGGLAPQGYLLLEDDDLIVPSSVAFPARFDASTGRLKEFDLPAQGRLTGGWFASTPAEKEQQRLKRRGLLFDSGVNKTRHEDHERVTGQAGIRSTIHAGDRALRFGDGLEAVPGPIHEMLVAQGRLYAVTLSGDIHCLAGNEAAPVVHRHRRDASKERFKQQMEERKRKKKADPLVTGIREASAFRHGHALVLGMSERWMGLAQAPSAQLVGVGKDPALLRSHLERKGVSLARCTLLKGDPLELELPPYFARLIVVDASADIAWTPGFLSGLYSMLRPYGASLCVAGSKQERAVFRSVVAAAELPGARLSEHDGFSRLQRSGPLPGATNYLGDWAKSPDERVRFPLGVLWFDDALGHFKRSPQPKFVDGVMVSTTKKWVVDKDERVAGKIDYRLTPAVLSDVYTGRVMGSDEETEIRKKHGKVDLKTLQPSQYRPPKQLNDWAPKNQAQVNASIR